MFDALEAESVPAPLRRDVGAMYAGCTAEMAMLGARAVQFLVTSGGAPEVPVLRNVYRARFHLPGFCCWSRRCGSRFARRSFRPSHVHCRCLGFSPLATVGRGPLARPSVCSVLMSGMRGRGPCCGRGCRACFGGGADCWPGQVPRSFDRPVGAVCPLA